MDIPDDVRRAASSVIAKHRQVDGSAMSKVQEASQLIAEAILVERNRCLEVVAARKAIYQTHLDAADVNGEEVFNRWYLNQHAVEAFGHLEYELQP